MNVAAVTILLAVIAGALTALQAPTNAMLSRPLDLGDRRLLLLLVGTCARNSRPDAALAPRILRGSGAALYAWLAASTAPAAVTVAAFGAPRIGVGVLFTAIIAGQSSPPSR
jgi:uncharacterized membrane protein YdcZ (DUF606 family)